MRLGKLSQVLVDIEYDGNGDDECDGKEVGSDELAYNVPVECLDEPERVDTM